MSATGTFRIGLRRNRCRVDRHEDGVTADCLHLARISRTIDAAILRQAQPTHRVAPAPSVGSPALETEASGEVAHGWKSS